MSVKRSIRGPRDRRHCSSLSYLNEALCRPVYDSPNASASGTAGWKIKLSRANGASGEIAFDAFMSRDRIQCQLFSSKYFPDAESKRMEYAARLGFGFDRPASRALPADFVSSQPDAV